MNSFEFGKISDATLSLDNARDMISSFWSDYLETTDYTRLKEDDPEHIAIKMLAISEFVDKARLALDMLFVNSKSSLVSTYLKDADDFKKYQREKGGDKQ